MIEFIKYTDEKWNLIVHQFKNYDTYYTKEYAQSFMINEEGVPYLIYFHTEKTQLCYPVMEKDIANFSSFRGKLKKGTFYDWNTPYGYGGPLADCQLSDEEQLIFLTELKKLAKERMVVSQFIRFHPIIKNHLLCPKAIETVYLKDTIYINLDTKEDLMRQMDAKNRNLIRKALKNNVVIKHDKGKFIDEFRQIYNQTMERDNARDFYFFPLDYYLFLKEKMIDNTEFFYAIMDEKIIAASIFFYDNKQMHYHLSGNLTDYRTYAPTNLLLYEAAKFGQEKGLKTLHLGGGVGIEDSLFHFKKQFNKEGRIGFYMGRNIFDQEAYNYLLDFRANEDDEFDKNNSYYIQYRKP